MDQCSTQDLDGAFTLEDGAVMRSPRSPDESSGGAAARLWLLPLMALVWSSNAAAYRPFDSTDADVVDPGEIEIELSPLSYRRGDGGNTLIAPAVVVNYGFAPRWEVIVEGEGEHPSGRGRSSMVGNALLLKHVIRDGSLQAASGLSVATEFGFELPGINAESGTGAIAAGIVSHESSWGALHFTAEAVHTRDSSTELAFGSILEGPGEWPVRPVVEVFYAHELGEAEEAAVLVGAIWKFNDNLVFDAGVRRSVLGEERDTELRLGLSFAFSVR